MSIILHRNRMLVNGFREDSLPEFIKKNTVFQKKITFGYDEMWTGIKDIVYEGEKYFALPRNFPSRFLYSYLENDEIGVKKDDYYIPYRTCGIKMNPDAVPRNEMQVDILDFLAGRGQYKGIKDKPRRALFADTDSGKTFTTIKDICEKDVMSVIVCPDDRAIKTWIEEFQKFTDIKSEEIAVVKGRDRMRIVLKNKDKYKLVLLSNRTCSFIFKDKADDELLHFFEEMQIGRKVYDELHMGLECIFYMEMLLVTHSTFYLTATNIKRIHGEQVILDHMTPSEDCVYQPPPLQKFEYIEVGYHLNASADHSKGINKPNGFDALVYLKMLGQAQLDYKDWFLQKVLRPSLKLALKNLSDDTNRIAILTKTNESGEWIGEYIATEFPHLTIGYFNSKTAAKFDDRLPELDRNVIISTDRSFAGILNIPHLEVIINVTPVTSEAHIKQIAGRLRKEKDKRRIFIQLGDLSFKKARNMMYRERKVMEEVSISMDRITVGKPQKEVSEEDD
jgi:hypothetical protein